MSFLIMEMDGEKISNFYENWKDVCELKSAHRAILVFPHYAELYSAMTRDLLYYIII